MDKLQTKGKTSQNLWWCLLYPCSIRERKKLDKKAEVGILVGYSFVTKGYRVYNVSSHKIIFNRDVKIDEDRIWNWENDEVTPVEVVHQFVEPPIHTQSSQCEVQEDSVNEEPDEEDNGEENYDMPPRGFRSLEDIYARCNLATLEPNNCYEALQSDAWKNTMEEEPRMIEKNNTWAIVTQPVGKKIIGVKWVFKLKLNVDGTMNRHKARLDMERYSQEAREDFFDSFALVARLDTIRLLLLTKAGLFIIWMLNQLFSMDT